MAISLRQMKEKAAAVNSIIEDVFNSMVEENEDVELLLNNYSQLYSMILDISETLDVVISDIEK